MKLSISHIAWPQEFEEFYLKNLRGWGCTGLEVAPTRLWPDPLQTGKSERQQFLQRMQDCALEISALHALLYQRHDLGLFKEREVESKTIKYLQGLCRLAAELGARVLVFGSPANRKRGDLLFQEALERAAAFFYRIAQAAADLGVCLCIEPLGPQETDFISSAQEGLMLVDMVNSKGFGLHLDAKAVAAEPEDFSQILAKVQGRIRHFHINDPGLVEINSTGLVDHQRLAKGLQELGYPHYVSIEMRTMSDYPEAIRRSLAFVRKTYISFSR